MKPIQTILCIGAGYVGGPTMVVMADRCPEYRFLVTDINADRLRAWQSGNPPIYEPGLQEILARVLNRNLFFTPDADRAIEEADLIFVSVNTPTKTFGQGAGMAADLQYWEKTARQIKARARTPKIVVEKSTVPVRTAEAMERILNAGGGPRIEVLSNPEFLAEGTAIRDLLQPDRVLIGGPETPNGREAMEALATIYAHWVPRERILTMDVWSSELAKLAANAFLAQRISSINALTGLCEATGADITRVAQAVGLDSRIGPRFLEAGVGFGGSCFQKDVLNLVYLCEAQGLPEAAHYWRQVVVMNLEQRRRFVRQIVSRLFNTLVDKRIALFGFAFKPDTGDTRESPAIAICRQLVEERAQVVVTDPQALPNAHRDLADLGTAVLFEPDPYRAAEGAHAIALLTAWSEYRRLDYRRIFERMVQPAFLFDGRNALDHHRLFEIGFNVCPTGKPALLHS
jgi:UDPglucose 6-dehydrogenase